MRKLYLSWGGAARAVQVVEVKVYRASQIIHDWCTLQANRNNLNRELVGMISPMVCDCTILVGYNRGVLATRMLTLVVATADLWFGEYLRHTLVSDLWAPAVRFNWDTWCKEPLRHVHYKNHIHIHVYTLVYLWCVTRLTPTYSRINNKS